MAPKTNTIEAKVKEFLWTPMRSSRCCASKERGEEERSSCRLDLGLISAADRRVSDKAFEEVDDDYGERCGGGLQQAKVSGVEQVVGDTEERHEGSVFRAN
uniref:Uncharacterized protein n=1 Tax=Nelumbo nucifera TaxID=4432 RepID=A0A822YTQ0_NELNU|nr:TPA_asm: hypothetical protein HUJ06_011459 [Nelumbo nucifera]